MNKLPEDYEAEQAVLGSIIRYGKLDADSMFLSPADFYHKPHINIFQSILDLYESDTEIDPFLIGNILKKTNSLDSSGGYSYISQLSDLFPSSGDVLRYANIVKEKSRLRRLISKTTEIAEKGSEPNVYIDDLIAEVVSAVNDISQSSMESTYSEIKPLIAERFAEYEKYGSGVGGLPGISSGFVDLDMITNGLQPGKMITIAARPGVGKTSLALNMILHSSKKNVPKGAIVFISYEMLKEELTDRFITADAKVNYNLLQRGKLKPDDYDRLALSMDIISTYPIVIIDKKIPIESMEVELKRIEKEYGSISSIWVDYLQRAKVKSTRLPREQQIALISGAIKDFAIDFKCPAVALSQLNRDLEKRTDKKPMLSDLRESGVIEQDSDIIIFIYRDEMYNDKTEEPGIAEIIVSKNRSGPVSSCKLRFQEQFTRFDNLTKRSFNE